MLLGIFGLNSCVALGVAAGVGYAVPWVVAISCSELEYVLNQSLELQNKLKEMKTKIEKEIEEKIIFRITILSKRKIKKF